ncbi:Sigma-54-dependent Fis family transcriptional regulator [Sulfidibacter corallicola]|uniref:Sigma-54-dependent Fis family transcriptional regulator n=1 Tax=Sulfidibacter corallicola TaxID=2818388 RepID=A0A8A4TYV7_SULCO|nr:sigma-54 dependent transcriptional regulator [Sulfidibacter corallicola]QTD54284.1 sigma-54-dependent Fis family transcriptional regulator [Sulfidibacter corallicola]
MEPNAKIFLVEDEPVVQDVLKRLFRPLGYKVKTADRGDEALVELESGQIFDLIITDLNLPGVSGLEVAERARDLCPDVPVIVITAYASVDSAVGAMKAGAFDYLTKPFNNDQVLLVVKKAIEKRRLVEENRQLRRELDSRYGFENLVGNSEPIIEVFDLVRQAAPATATILIRGESGTGKELIARAVHHNSPRRDKPFVALNAGSIPSDLLESQLFGHVKGAFTGAVSEKKGLFELADTGTLFLDEVGNISLEIQAKLLRVLQEKEFMPVGSTETVRVDVRLVCATNADLEKMITDGKFREDLYYRLNVIEVHMPSLRERVGDIPLLVDYFIRKFEKENNKAIAKVEPDFVAALEAYPWPGNVRELENLMERAVVLSREGNIDTALLPQSFHKRQETVPDNFPDLEEDINFHEQIQAYERALILKALKKADNVQKKAAGLLGLKTTTFSEMMKRHKLR